MLQIVQGHHFRDVPRTDYVHRAILYTNLRSFPRASPTELMFGRVFPSTIHEAVATITVEAREQLEAETLSGQAEVLVATSGDQLIDEIAATLCFYFNAVCVRSPDQARRLISQSSNPEDVRSGPGSILRQTFDARAVFSDEQTAAYNRFLLKLTGLGRREYEAAMRAIRQIVDATLMVAEDVTLAYTLLVAALESLAQNASPHPSSWHDYDPVKRKRIDEATADLSGDQRARLRSALLENEHLSLQRRFISFVLDHTGPSFYRAEAVGAIRPISASDLPAALQTAYRIRSRNVHALQNLPPEVWMMADRSDTADLAGATVLSLEGLARLARHVVRQFVERQQTRAADDEFDYRSALPGIMQVQFAPEYWIHIPQRFNAKTAPGTLKGMIDRLVEGLADRQEALLVDMSAVLDRIATLAPGLQPGISRHAMSGIVALGNGVLPEEHHLLPKRRLKEIIAEDMAQPTIVSFAITLLVEGKVGWPLETLRTVAEQRVRERRKADHQPMPKRLDAALHLLLADRLQEAGEMQLALQELARAVETAPGLAELIEYEAAQQRGEDPVFHLLPFLLSKAQPSEEKVADGSS